MNGVLDLISMHLPWMALVFFRLGGLTLYAPVFSSGVIPVRVKVFFALIVTAATYPLLSATALGGQTIELSLWTLVPLIAMEITIGAALGFLINLPMVGIQTGGLVMGQQMGLGFARFFNPAVEDEGDVLGQILYFMVLAGFLMIGGHEMMLIGLLNSFEHLPVGSSVTDMDFAMVATGLLGAAFELALRVAAPLLALVFLESVAMGFMSKTVPQLNILSLGFPVRILLGLGMIAMGLAVIDEVLMEQIDAAMNLVFAHGG